MQRSVSTVVLVGTLLSAGCTPSPEVFCDRKIRLAEDQWGKMRPDVRAAGRRNCLAEARKLKSENPKRFACAAACVVDAKNLHDAADCDANCR